MSSLAPSDALPAEARTVVPPASPWRSTTGRAAILRLEQHWLDITAIGQVSTSREIIAFCEAYRRLEGLARTFGMPADHDDAVDWVEEYLSQAKATPAFVIGTPEYRARMVSKLWHNQLWHEAVMVGMGGVCFFLMLYAVAKSLPL